MSSGGVHGVSEKNLLKMTKLMSFEMVDLLQNLFEHAVFEINHQI